MIDHVSLYTAELRPSLLASDDLPLLHDVLAAASDRLTRRGRSVRYVSATYRPEDGRLLCVFEASAIESVREVLAAANLSTIRVCPAAGLADLDPLIGEA